MGDEHLDTIPATKSDKVRKSSVEDLVPIPNQFEDFNDSKDDFTSIDDDYFSIDDIDYVKASPPDSELVSLEEVKDDILREKLLNIYLLIAKIESLNDNPTPDRVLKSPSPFLVPIKDSDSLFEKSDTFLSYSDNSLPKFKTFSDHTKATKLIRKLFNDVKIIHEELAKYINTPSWNRPAFYDYDDDDEDYTIAITPVLSTEEPVDSLIMEDEHLDTILATELDEVIKSSVEDHVSIPSESEGIPDNMCDVPFCDNSSPLNISKDQFKDFSDSSDDSTSIDDDYFSIDDIDYVEASPPDSELVSLEEVKNDILHEKLLNIHLLIAKIESLNDNPTSDRVLKSPSLILIPVKDSDSFFEKSDTSLSYSDNSLPEFETFSDHTKETSSGSTTTHADNSLPEYDSFLF
nr:hypothetical protein [Tanacetum cinerariifolium]